MFLIYGRQTARIKKFTDNQECCKNCRAFDMEIKVYRDYYHLYYIPVFPVGYKTASARCKSCGEPLRSDSVLKHYENISRTAFYLYSLPILIACIILGVVYANYNTQKEKEKLVNDPKAGDVYTIRKQVSVVTTYYFLRLSRVNGDSVFAYHSNLEYSGYVSNLQQDDYFVKDDEMWFTKAEIKKMLEHDEINNVDRDYEDYHGFDRIR